MSDIAAKKKKSPSKSASIKELTAKINHLAETSSSHNQQLVKELSSMREDVSSMKAELARKNRERAARTGFRAPRLFGRPRSQPEPIAVPARPSINVEDLLPLLPHLSGVIPQLGNPKVADAMKMLSNPAIMSMIQQFLQGNTGLLKQNSAVVPQSARRRALL